jgi:hypothetical protein
MLQIGEETSPHRERMFGNLLKPASKGRSGGVVIHTYFPI